MRESGFDPSNRFGPFSADIIHYAPVCLNALLYQMERDLAEIAAHARATPQRPAPGTRAPTSGARASTATCGTRPQGLYLDYDFETGKRRAYPFATTFYPLWAGAASPAQAARVRENLPLLRGAGRPAHQHDDERQPVGRALRLGAAAAHRGGRACAATGYTADADRLARKFIALVTKEFERTARSWRSTTCGAARSDVAADIRFGYSENQIGFGWTNGAYLELLAALERGNGGRVRGRPARPLRPRPGASGSPPAARARARTSARS